MKFKITITADVIDRSKHCQARTDSCAFALAYGELVPACIGIDRALFYSREGLNDGVSGIEDARGCIISSSLTPDQTDFVRKFDGAQSDSDFYSLVGQTFDVEIPDEVIEYWYGDASKAAQKIIDNPIMQVVCTGSSTT